jgi:hypothetical protein
MPFVAEGPGRAARSVFEPALSKRSAPKGAFCDAIIARLSRIPWPQKHERRRPKGPRRLFRTYISIISHPIAKSDIASTYISQSKSTTYPQNLLPPLLTTFWLDPETKTRGAPLLASFARSGPQTFMRHTPAFPYFSRPETLSRPLSFRRASEARQEESASPAREPAFATLQTILPNDQPTSSKQRSPSLRSCQNHSCCCCQ